MSRVSLWLQARSAECSRGADCCNLLSGAISILFISQGRYDLPLLLMGIGAAFDFLDGFAARLLKAYSPVGKELDSLADLISFGLVPALLLQQRYTAVVAAF